MNYNKKINKNKKRGKHPKWTESTTFEFWPTDFMDSSSSSTAIYPQQYEFCVQVINLIKTSLLFNKYHIYYN